MKTMTETIKLVINEDALTDLNAMLQTIAELTATLKSTGSIRKNLKKHGKFKEDCKYIITTLNEAARAIDETLIEPIASAKLPESIRARLHENKTKPSKKAELIGLIDKSNNDKLNMAPEEFKDLMADIRSLLWRNGYLTKQERDDIKPDRNDYFKVQRNGYDALNKKARQLIQAARDKVLQKYANDIFNELKGKWNKVDEKTLVEKFRHI
jgi:ElaB/YqjD/DUF883 family membrane-anchored ribosome-binding protein